MTECKLTKHRSSAHHFSLIYYYRNPEFDRKCAPGGDGGCWYCCHKCDVCMLDSTAGFSTRSREDTKLTFRFCGEECQSFNDHSRVSPPLSGQKQDVFITTVKEPLEEVTFFLVDSCGMQNGDVKSTHLLSITLSSCDEQGTPLRAAIDMYRVKEGNGQLPSGRFIALFELRTLYNQMFSEFFLTDELQLEQPLPHVKIQVDIERSKLLNAMLREGIEKSGHNVDHFCSKGLSVSEPLTQGTGTEDDNCDEFVGLDY